MNKLVFDSVHNYIEIESELLQFIDTPEFQRLRNIKQLGSAYKVYIGATHTRFEHSIGVSYLCGLLITNIKNKQPELNITDRDVILIKIAGLCHDLGHACFSHFFDDYFLKTILKDSEFVDYSNHEYRSEIMIRHIISKYNLEYTNDEINFICDLINNKKKNKKPKKSKTAKPEFMYEIVANNKSGLDCDKIDYLLRDTQNVGIQCSFQYNCLLNQARVIDDTICYPEKEVFNIYELFHTRFKMHKQIYQHPVINGIDFMILDILNLINDEFKLSTNINNVDKFITYTDNIIDVIKYCSNNEIVKQLINDLESRKLYKFGGEIIYDDKNEEITKKIDDFRSYIKDINMEDNIIITKFNINFNLRNKNPIDQIYFYKISKNNEKFKIKKKMVSLMLPSVFEETIVRFIIKKDIIIKDISDCDILCSQLCSDLCKSI